METVLVWAGVTVGVLAGCVLLLLLIGSQLPRGRQVRRSLTISRPPETIWKTITNFADVPNWHSQVVKVERVDDHNGHDVWKETYKGNFGVVLETTEATAPKRLVRTIADEKGPFTGYWEYALTPVGNGCHISITEYGEIANPFIRLMARALMDPAKYLEMYLAALAAKFGEPATIDKAA